LIINQINLLGTAEHEKLALEMRLLQQVRVATKQLLVVTIENFKKFPLTGKNFRFLKKRQKMKKKAGTDSFLVLHVHRCTAWFCLTERGG
jgi:hypothetical protein